MARQRHFPLHIGYHDSQFPITTGVMARQRLVHLHICLDNVVTITHLILCLDNVMSHYT